MRCRYDSGKRYTVYKHIFPDNKVYFGITSNDTETRWKGGFGYQQQKELFSKIVKYGWDNIKHEIIATDVPEDKARDMEELLIKEFKPIAMNKVFNEEPPRYKNEYYSKYLRYWTINGVEKLDKEWCSPYDIAPAKVIARLKCYDADIFTIMQLPFVDPHFSSKPVQWWERFGIDIKRREKELSENEVKEMLCFREICR